MYIAALLTILSAGLAAAHTRIWSLEVGGKKLGDLRNKAIRSPPTNSPVKLLGGPDVPCNVNGNNAVPEFVEIPAGSLVTTYWYHDSITPADDIVARSHNGTFTTFIASYTDDVNKPIWSKIAEQNFDANTGRWPSLDAIDSKGKVNFTLNKNIAQGKYVLRQELIALHEADSAYSKVPARGVQLYPNCMQIKVTGSGTVVPNQGLDFKTIYTENDPGLVFDMYNKDAKTYVVPGGSLYKFDGDNGAASTSTTSANMTSSASSDSPATPATPPNPTKSGSSSGSGLGSGCSSKRSTPVIKSGFLARRLRRFVIEDPR